MARKNILGIIENDTPADVSAQNADVKELRDLKAARVVRDQGASPAAVAARVAAITGRPAGVIPSNASYEDLRAQREAQNAMNFTPQSTPAVGTTSKPAVAPVVGAVASTAPVKPNYVAPGRTGVFMDGKELPRQIGGGVVTDPTNTNALGMEYQPVVGGGVATNAVVSRPGSNVLKSVDPNVAIGMSRGNVGSATNAGGIVIANNVDRGSGVIGQMPGQRSASQIAMADSFKGPRFNLRPRKGVEEANAVAQGAIGAINAKGGYDERIAKNQTEAARSNADAARFDAGLDRTSKENIAQGRNDAEVLAAEARGSGRLGEVPRRKAAFIERQMSMSDRRYEDWLSKNEFATPEQKAEKLAAHESEFNRMFNEREALYGTATGETAAQPPGVMSPDDQSALQWAQSNPNDPRASAIKQRLNVR